MEIKKTKLNFQAGLTSQMRREIASCDIQKISRHFQKNGITTDFKQNKVIAWCSLKCLEIIETLNKNYKLKLGLPKGIFVEDFNQLNVIEKNSSGFINIAPTKLYTNKNTIVPEKTLFFNQNNNGLWDNIDEYSDYMHETNLLTTDFFLEIFLHEFAHAIHEENLIKKLGGEKLIQILHECFSYYNMDNFHTKYKCLFSKISDYACKSPIEAVACDLSSRIINATDKNSLIPVNNCIKSSPYNNSMFYCPPDTLSKKLRDYWKGKFIG